MNNQLITSPNQVTPEWLTTVLANSGALINGSVTAIDIVKGQGNWSNNAKLRIHYSESSLGAMPRDLLLKTVNTNLGEGESFNDSEVTYYTQDYVEVPDAPLIRCYTATYAADQQAYTLLLDDWSSTHIVAADKTPTLEYGLALVEGLAVMHAHWWGAKNMAEANVSIHKAEHINRFVEIAHPGVEHILNNFTPELKPHWPEMIHTIFAKHPQALINRTKNPNGFTIIHGDVGERNVLVPRDADRPIFIIDRQPFNWSLTNWLGVYDIAYAIVLDWEPEARSQFEIPLLKHYYEELLRHGVSGYSWENLYDDYRLSVAMGVYIATEYCRGGINKRWASVWMTMLKRSLITIDDLNCTELWE